MIAVENGVLRALTDAEELEFQQAMYGGKVESANRLASKGMLTILLTIRIRLADQGRG